MTTLRIQVKRQVAFSKTSREGFVAVSKRAFWCFVYLLKAIRLGFSAMKTTQILSKAVYDGRDVVISNWANSNFMTICGDGFYKENVPKSEIRPVISAGELIHRFNFKFDWYLQNWYDIDIHKRLYPK